VGKTRREKDRHKEEREREREREESGINKRGDIHMTVM
jgi:hypothetical protein